MLASRLDHTPSSKLAHTLSSTPGRNVTLPAFSSSLLFSCNDTAAKSDSGRHLISHERREVRRCAWALMPSCFLFTGFSNAYQIRASAEDTLTLASYKCKTVSYVGLAPGQMVLHGNFPALAKGYGEIPNTSF